MALVEYTYGCLSTWINMNQHKHCSNSLISCLVITGPHNVPLAHLKHAALCCTLNLDAPDFRETNISLD